MHYWVSSDDRSKEHIASLSSYVIAAGYKPRQHKHSWSSNPRRIAVVTCQSNVHSRQG